MTVPNATELHTEAWLRWEILHYVYLTTIKKKKANQTSHTRGTRVRPHEDMLGTRSPRGAGPPGTPS